MKHWLTQGYVLLSLAGLLVAPSWASYPEYEQLQNTNANPSPPSNSSHVNDYINQDEQINLLPSDGLVKVLRTDQKNLVNDYVTRIIPVQNATVREMRNVVRRMVALEGGRAEALINPNTKEKSIQVIAPAYMIPYLEDAIRGLDVEWLREYTDGATDSYLKMQHREAAQVDRIARNYGSDEGFSRVDRTNNALSRSDEAYRVEKYAEAVQIVDIPPNEVELEVKIYEVNATNDLKLGLDYVNWKNGPGRNLFQFATAGYKEFQRARDFTSVYDPFVNAGREVAGDDKRKIADFDGRDSYRAVNYLLTSNFVDFLQTKGQARVINEQKLLLISATLGNINNTDQVVALKNNLNDTTSGLDSSGVTIGRTNGADHSSSNIGNTGAFMDLNNNGVQDPGEPSLVDNNNSDLLPDEAGVFPNSPAGMNLPVANFGRTLKFEIVDHVGMSLRLVPYVGLESMELLLKLQLSDLNGYAPSGQPIINSRTIKTTIRLLDGQPFVMAGVAHIYTVRNTNKAPLLGSIPIVGYLFGGENDSKRKSDIVVVVTPRFHLSNEVNLATPPRIRTLDLMIKKENGPKQGGPSLRFGYDQWLLDRS